MKVFSALSTCYCLSLCVEKVQAYMDGAGTCRQGSLGTFDSVTTGHGNQGMGSLSAGSLEVRVGPTTLGTSSPLEIFIETDYTVQLEFTASSGSGFKGFLFRLSSTSNGVDVSDALVVRSGSDDAQKLPSTGERDFKNSVSNSACAEDVAGVTHTNNGIKSLVSSITLNVEDVTDLVLEVTVMLARATDNWYYSSFELKAVTPPTQNPSAQPSVSPSESFKPSSAPSQHPSSAPSQHPSSAPSQHPSSAPSQHPSSAPSQHPSSAPSQHPSSAPSQHPSSAPSQHPSSAPSQHPSSAPIQHPSMTPSTSLEPSSAPVITPAPTPASGSADMMIWSLVITAGIVTFMSVTSLF